MAKSRLNTISPKSLLNINLSLAKEWHPTKNGFLTPADVTYGSDKKVWWHCSKGHEWQAIVSNRIKGSGCPYCCGKAVCSDNCLQTMNPRLAKEWHPNKNSHLGLKLKHPLPVIEGIDLNKEPSREPVDAM